MIRYFSSLRMTFLFALIDFISLLAVCTMSVFMRLFFDGKFDLDIYIHLVPSLFFFIAAYALVGLYPGVLLSPVEELKKMTQTSSVIFLALTGAVFLSRQGELYSRGIFLIAWVGTLIVLPVVRAVLRRNMHRRSWWGQPVVLLGAGKTAGAVLEALKRDHRLGLRPVALYDDDPAKIGSHVQGLFVRGTLESIGRDGAHLTDCAAIVAMPGVKPARLVEILEGVASNFRRLIIIPDLFGASSLWVSAFDLGGILGLEVRQKLLDPQRQFIKRCIELVLVILTLPLWSSISAIIAIFIKCDSVGPVLYCHKRIGRSGRDILIWKFRTMVQDAEDKLEQCLEADSEMRAEWEENQKLRCDPRITRVGRFLRRTSLDELPQLWNVLGGDLSLVGPRPIVWSEVDKYTGGFELYKKVKPGLTGLWQISGRSNTSYTERVRLDAYYVRNWSVWFDMYIILKTPLEVLRCRGAC